MTTLERLEEAVSSADDIRWLRGYLQGHLDSGLPADKLHDVLERSYERLRDRGEDAAADLVLDGMDLVTGWCGPGMGLRVPETA